MGDVLKMFLPFANVETSLVHGLPLMELAVIRGCTTCVELLLQLEVSPSRLDFSNFDAGHFGTWDDHTFAAMKILPRLDDFTFVATDFDDQFTADLVLFLPKLQHLKALKLRLPSTVNGTQYAEALGHLTQLESLDLSDSRIDISRFTALSPGLGKLNRL